MKIVRPYAKIARPMDGVMAMKWIELAARISHRSEDAVTDQSWQRFIQAVVVDRGDWSVTEHVSLSVDFFVDRGITHEIVRHRHFSYTQESTRFVNYDKKMPPSFVYPQPDVECPHCMEGSEPWGHLARAWRHEGGTNCSYDPSWLLAIESAETQYKSLLKKGWRPQEARSVLPNALGSMIRMTGNLRAWRWFLLMRTTKETHPQMKQVTVPLLYEFQSTIPLLYDDIEPGQSQAAATAKRH